ncbi:type I polyketide synthase [Aeromicrobium choanae]|uniref:Fatty acid synthase, bacterial type n=1 Tax=Aeromicrobium choanae TaxID=1736691 RepID=A0A1T4Z4I3_9ACTN|nr:type I polyketide synthase [Aeromicrobium choanae]SKB08465.1 fatty acid synthase, bacterial type [Aeromicrobium choanae]
MTTLDTSVFHAPTSRDRRTDSLLDDLRSGTPWALVLGGQGGDWLGPLADLVRDFALDADVADLVRRSDRMLAPVATELARAGVAFDPVAWVDVLAVGESAEDDDAPGLPAGADVTAPAASVPGITLAQLAGLRALSRQGLDVAAHPPVAVAGHSQGVLAAEALAGVPDVEVLALARLVGAAAQLVGRRRGLLGQTMLAVSGVVPERVAAIVEGTGAVCHIRNGRRSVVLSGPSAALAAATARLEQVAADEKDERERKVTGGAPFSPVIEPVESALAFHHPDLAETAELVAGWAARIGIDAEHARHATQRAIIDPVDWVVDVTAALDAGAEWVLDLGPGDLASRLTAAETRSRGVGLVAPTTRRGHRELTITGARPTVPVAWSTFAPRLVTLPDGSTSVETAFTRATGKSPILLAGMTPTTVDAPIVAAAANAGFWSELAGGGQVTEEIFDARLVELDSLLDEGATFQFNSLFLDPYLWRLQLGQNRLVQRARAAGAPIDAVIVTAGIPELDDAVALVDELTEAGIEHVVFKPGTVRQIREVLAIAKKVDRTVIVQVEGGRAGGHHSWEDLDDLILATYGELRAQSNVVLCVGGGIGTSDAAAAWLTGTWAQRHGFLDMPVDGILVGTAAMATLEATTAPEVKQLLVETRGTGAWVGAGTAKNGMASGRSQLGADIHEIDNTASRTGRLLDEVAGDADAVARRRDEIVEALDRTAKPYFGDVAAMTYARWLGRFVELSGTAADGSAQWLDVSLRDRFHALAQRAEARLAEQDRGEIATLFAEPADVEDGPAALDRLLAAYPDAASVTLHPADEAFFVEVCRRAGKPVNFVPVVDADVRRWWRSDSLWQAHDPRYGADEVCVIPGTASVAGITRVDEPVADLLQRFEDAAVDALLASGRAPQRVPARRREGDSRLAAPLAVVLAAPDVVWAGRTVTNPVHRLGAEWVLTDTDSAEQAATGARLVAAGDSAADLTVPLGHGRELTLRIEVPSGSSRGHAPVVTTDAAVSAMAQIVSGAVAGSLPEVSDGVAHLDVDWDPDLAADHAAVSAGPLVLGRHRVPDVLVGLAWPAVFAVIGDARNAEGVPVVEGMLDLVHLDHAITAQPLPTERTSLEIRAALTGVEESQYGRVVTVDVTVGDVATMRERFAIRGRTGAATLADPARAGDVLGDDEVKDTPRRTRARVTVTAPSDLGAFASVTGDHNPIHTSVAAARLAGLGAPIVHGMWTSAAAQHAVADETGRRIAGWTTRFMAPVAPGAEVEVRADRVGLSHGREVLDVTVRAEGEIVMAASAVLDAPRTAYAFPGQGIQSPGMGMAGYQRCPAAREVWDRADKHTRSALGFSILTVVRDNPTDLTVRGVTHHHPDGVLYLTQFTQVAMAVLGAAQMAELREGGAFVDGAVLAGHSVGEYNALAAVSGVISLEAVVEVVFQRGSVMHTLVPRDEKGRSDYRLAAIRPSQIGLADDEVKDYVEGLGEASGEFLQIVNYNMRGSQYAIAGTVRGLEVLEKDVADRRERFGGKAAFILVPGIDVPFHSRVLHGGVPDFRHKLQELLPPTIDPAILEGRYVPNLVPKPFSLDEDFIREVEQYVGTTVPRSEDPGMLCRDLLIELLAWQFASPVRWIETQDLMFTPVEEGGLGVERFVEVGVGSAPTVANLAAGTLKLPGYPSVEVLNVERDAAAVYGTDEDPAPVEDEAPEATVEDSAPQQAAAPAAAPAGGPATQTAADLPFSAADATKVLIAWWTKLRLDQLGAADTIESLTDGASSRRNQLLIDLGGELSLGAIDGAAEADIVTLGGQVDALARTYKPFGPVLAEAFGDHLKKVLGPTGRKQSAVAERVTGAWQLGSGWASHVLAELAMVTREGQSVRGGAFGEASIASAGDVDAAIDAAVQAVAARHGVTVQMPSAGGGDGATIDAEALGEFTAAITGRDGVLASAARLVLEHLDLVDVPETAEPDEQAAAVVARVEAELGTDWIKATEGVFDAEHAVVLDDRWASAREDLARLAHGDEVVGSFAATGEVVAKQAEHWLARTGDERFARIAEDARDTTAGTFAGEVAVVTGAADGSIAGSAVGELLAGGATVVATTSSLAPKKLRFFKDLYRRNARAGAVLWVVPANLASFADVDALVEWIGAEQSRTAAGVTTVSKPSLTPTLLVPFAAGRVMGDATEAGPRAELEMRILLWSVERLVGALSSSVTDRNLDARLHVLLPGSPNRGMFGGDGAYGEAKAALDALVTKWGSEKRWADKVTLAHAIIGWVRGTGLMGGNDPLVEAVEAAGVRTWSPAEMAAALLEACTPQARQQATEGPLTFDLTGGLGEADLDMKALAAEAGDRVAGRGTSPRIEINSTIPALPAPPSRLDRVETPEWAGVTARPEDLVVIVGAGELGPYGSARTRFEMEVEDRLSAAGVLELAWSTGLLSWDATNRGWFDTESGEVVAEHEIADRYEDAVRERIGVRRYADDGDMVDNSAPLLASVYLDHDLTFTVSGQAEAQAMRDADPEHTVIAQDGEGEWTVTRRAGTQVRVPRKMKLTRTVGGQIPTGFDPTVWGVPAEMVEAVDRVALWNLICTVDAFLSSGFTPSELMRWTHPTLVANTQGTGMGGMTSMHSLYIDTLLGEAKPNDILQEALPNVIAAHVVQSYVGSYGAMVHPVAACATTAVSVEEGVDKIRLNKAEFVVAGGFDDLSVEGIVGFGDMSATADSAAMAAKGLEDRYFSRANDRRYGGFVESQGGGTILLARGDLAARMGLPVLGVVAYAASFADGVHTSIPAPGLGALAAGRGGRESQLARSLSALGVGADDIGVLSKHDTSTGVNERNESELHERLAAALGRSEGNPLYVMSQKALTGHSKGGAAAFQLIGLCQVLEGGVLPPNRSLDCVMDDLAEHEHLVWLREPLATGPLKAGLLTSLGFGHVAGLIAVVHSQAFVESLSADERDAYLEAAERRRIDGRMRLVDAMYGGEALYRRPADRRLGDSGVREREAALLLDASGRLGEDGVYACR